MRAVLQRVKHASVAVNGEIAGEIGPGLLIFLGVTHDDDSRDVRYLADKCVNLRIFEDEAGKMNRSLADIAGAALIVSQFTLYGDAAAGRRPSFTAAARPEPAEALYREFIAAVQACDIPVGTGRFGAEMAVSLLNDGPVTLIVESKK